MNLKGVVIHMQKPEILEDGTITRMPMIATKQNLYFVAQEQFLRKTAYKDSEMKIDDSFFTDIDMELEYYLIIIYCGKSKTPLLSARYFYNRDVIFNYLQPSIGRLSEYKRSFSASKKDLSNELKNNNIFLIDRLSGNTSSKIYEKYRNYIFLELYLQIIKYNKGKLFLVMARSQEYEKLLTKYLRAGLNVVGETMHNEVRHWVLLGDVNAFISNVHQGVLLNSFLSVKILLVKSKSFFSWKRKKRQVEF